MTLRNFYLNTKFINIDLSSSSAEGVGKFNLFSFDDFGELASGFFLVKLVISKQYGRSISNDIRQEDHFHAGEGEAVTD